MKKVLLVLTLALLLAGCSAQEEAVFETIGEVSYEPVSTPSAGVISITLPEEAVAEAMAGESGGEVYTWGEYEVRVETVESGNIHKTVETITGMSADNLTVMQQKLEDLELYQTVWSSAGEDGVLLGRAMIADDGNYHYCVSILSPEDVDSSEVYAQIVSSFSLDGIRSVK